MVLKNRGVRVINGTSFKDVCLKVRKVYLRTGAPNGYGIENKRREIYENGTHFEKLKSERLEVHV